MTKTKLNEDNYSVQQIVNPCINFTLLNKLQVNCFVLRMVIHIHSSKFNMQPMMM